MDENALRQLPAMISIHRAGLALLAGNTDETARHATRALDLVDESDPLQRGAAAALLGLAHWTRAANWPSPKRATPRRSGGSRAAATSPMRWAVSLALADIQLARGRLREAQGTFEHALGLIDEHPGLRGAADMHVGLSEVLIERNELDEAAVHLDTERGARRVGRPAPAPLPVACHHARLLPRTRRPRWCARARSTRPSPSTRPTSRHPSDPSRRSGPECSWHDGDLDAAEGWARRRGFGVDDPLSYVHEFEYITLRPGARRTRCCRSRRRSDRAGELAPGPTPRRCRARRTGRQHHRDPHPALGDARRTWRPSGRNRCAARSAATSRTRGPHPAVPARRCCRHRPPALGRHQRREHARTPRRSSPPQSSPRARSRSAGVRPAALVDQLSDRELDVLRLLRSDLSGPDIARELHVSLNTLRTHTKHIYTKLGATNRREALTRAGELGL